MIDSLFKEQLDSLDKQLTEAIEIKKLEESFAEEANKRFEENLISFEKYYPEIARAIRNFTTETELSLHVCLDGSANIAEPKSGAALYNSTPRQQCYEQVEKNLESPNFCTVKYGQIFEPGKGDNRIHTQYMSKLHKLINEYSNETSNSNELLDQVSTKFPSAMIFGVGLGYHLEKLFSEVEFNYTFIVEPNFELFYSSLFCISWKDIIESIDSKNGCLFLYLGSTYEEFFDDLYKTVYDIGAFSIAKVFCYQHYPENSINDLIQDFFKKYFRLHTGFGFYDDAAVSMSHTIHHMDNSANFFNGGSLSSFGLSKTPVFVIGNGPSLDGSIEFLKENKDSAIIIAAGTALNTLLNFNIIPDFHVQIERPKRNFDILVDTTDKEILSKLNLLTTNVIYPETPELYNWTGLALKGNEAGTDYYAISRMLEQYSFQNIIPFSNPLVANTATSFAVTFGFSDIYLFGVDNGVPEDGRHHAKFSIYDSGKYKLIENYRHAVPGNIEGKIKANDLYMVSKYQLESLAKAAPKTNFFNVGHGAKLEGYYPLKEENILIEKAVADKLAVIEAIKSFFSKDNPKDTERTILSISTFDEIAAHIISIIDEPFSTREECLDILNRQARYIYSLKKSRYSHYHFIFKGSLLYFHCPLISSLFYFADENITLEMLETLLGLWRNYLEEIREDFKLNYERYCTWSFTE